MYDGLALFSSSKHEVLKVSYCDHQCPSYAVPRAESKICVGGLLSYTPRPVETLKEVSE